LDKNPANLASFLFPFYKANWAIKKKKKSFLKLAASGSPLSFDEKTAWQ